MRLVSKTNSEECWIGAGSFQGGGCLRGQSDDGAKICPLDSKQTGDSLHLIGFARNRLPSQDYLSCQMANRVYGEDRIGGSRIGPGLVLRTVRRAVAIQVQIGLSGCRVKNLPAIFDAVRIDVGQTKCRCKNIIREIQVRRGQIASKGPKDNRAPVGGKRRVA